MHGATNLTFLGEMFLHYAKHLFACTCVHTNACTHKHTHFQLSPVCQCMPGLFDTVRPGHGEATGCLFEMLYVGAMKQFLYISLISHSCPWSGVFKGHHDYVQSTDDSPKVHTGYRKGISLLLTRTTYLTKWINSYLINWSHWGKWWENIIVTRNQLKGKV